MPSTPLRCASARPERLRSYLRPGPLRRASSRSVLATLRAARLQARRIHPSRPRSAAHIECHRILAATDQAAPSLHVLHYASGVRALRRSSLLAPARLKSHATRPVTTHSPRVMPFAETARAPCARFARRSPLRQAQGSKVAAAKLRPTVEALGASASSMEAPPRPGSAKPRGAASECRAELRPPRHLETSHNGARYVFIRSQNRSRVALSGAPPALTPFQNVRLRLSPHILKLRQPCGLEQKAFCSLGAAFLLVGG